MKGRLVIGALEGYERKKCEHGGKEDLRLYYPPNSVSCIRDVDVKCSTTITKTCSKNELY